MSLLQQMRVRMHSTNVLQSLHDCVPTSVKEKLISAMMARARDTGPELREKSRHSQQQESHSDIETVPEEESVRLLDVEQ